MELTQQIAKHFREVCFGGNWTCVNLKETLADVSWQQATAQVHNLNTIATLAYHATYYVGGVTKVLQGKALSTKDAESFTHPPIHSERDWEALTEKIWKDAETFTALIEGLPDEKLWEDFTDPKYGSYYRNLQGIIEHLHYHLGQITLIKKLLLRNDKGA